MSSGVDYLTHPGRDLPAGVEAERFEVVVELLSLSRKERLRVRCQVPADDPSCRACSTLAGQRGARAGDLRHVRDPLRATIPTSPGS